jgi:hypothetical protein
VSPFLQPSPITGSYWDDARGPIGFLGAVTKFVWDQTLVKRKQISTAITQIHDASCTFAAQPEIVHTGEQGLVLSRIYEQVQIARRALSPYIDMLFSGSFENWRRNVEAYDADCYYCVLNGKPSVGCQRCGGTGTVHRPAMANDEPPHGRAVRIAFVTHELISKVVTTPQQHQSFLQRLTDVFDAGVVEAQAAGIPEKKLLTLEYSWRFYAVARRMPTDDDEELFLAFQAAWEAQHYDFARQLVTTNVTAT